MLAVLLALDVTLGVTVYVCSPITTVVGHVKVLMFDIV